MTTGSVIEVLLWMLIALWGVRVMSRAIGKNTSLISAAQKLGTNKVVIDHLKNVLFMYKTRLWLIVNNLCLGVLVILTSIGIVPIPQWIVSVYAAASLLVNELSFIYLTYRDERVLIKEANGSR